MRFGATGLSRRDGEAVVYEHELDEGADALVGVALPLGPRCQSQDEVVEAFAQGTNLQRRILGQGERTGRKKFVVPLECASGTGVVQYHYKHFVGMAGLADLCSSKWYLMRHTHQKLRSDGKAAFKKRGDPELHYHKKDRKCAPPRFSRFECCS